MPTLPAVDAVNSVVLGATLYDADNKMVDAADADGDIEVRLTFAYQYTGREYDLSSEETRYDASNRR